MTMRMCPEDDHAQLRRLARVSYRTVPRAEATRDFNRVHTYRIIAISFTLFSRLSIFIAIFR